MFKDQGMTAMAVYDSPTKKPFDMFLSMFGISSTHASNFMLGEDGKLQFKMISDQAKDYLAYMHQLYVDGIDVYKRQGFRMRWGKHRRWECPWL